MSPWCVVGSIKMPNGWQVDTRNKSEEYFEISQTLKDPFDVDGIGQIGWGKWWMTLYKNIVFSYYGQLSGYLLRG
jgi:hypothetical protein